MAYIGILEAFRARLEGQDPKYVPRLPSTPLKDDPRIAAEVDGGAVAGGAGSTVNVNGLTINIADDDDSGQWSVELWPMITYRVVANNPRYNEWISNTDPEQGIGDGYQIPIETSSQELKEGKFSLGSSPRLFKTRPVEIPIDFLVEVKLMANNNITSALLVDYVYRVLPPRSFIRVPMKDGTFASWDLDMQDFKDLDVRSAVLSGNAEKEYAKVFTYRVEGYLDNTDLAKISSRVRKVSINVT